MDLFQQLLFIPVRARHRAVRLIDKEISLCMTQSGMDISKTKDQNGPAVSLQP